MKRLLGGTALLLLLLAGSLVNAWYARTLTASLCQELDQAQTLAGQDQWDRAARTTQRAYDRWQGQHFYLHTVLRHSDTDEILRTFRTVFQYLALEEPDQYFAANAELMAQLALLAEMEQASLVNVL